RADEERLLVAVGVADGDDHPRAGDAFLRGRRLADLRVTKQRGELTDAGLHLALLFLRGVIAAVLAQVALGPRRADAFRDLDARRAGQVLELGGEPVVGLLRQPGDVGVGRLGHVTRLPAGAAAARSATITPCPTRRCACSP